MKIEQYLKDCQRTCPSLGSQELDLSHMVLGLGSEFLVEYPNAINRADTVNIGEEIGDLMWYTGNLYKFVGGTTTKEELSVYFGKPIVTSYPEININTYIGELCNIVKRFIAYKKEVDEVEVKKFISRVYSAACTLCQNYNIDFELVLENNINKLKARFPEKFTEERALNRNLQKEYELLSRNMTVEQKTINPLVKEFTNIINERAGECKIRKIYLSKIQHEDELDISVAFDFEYLDQDYIHNLHTVSELNSWLDRVLPS